MAIIYTARNALRGSSSGWDDLYFLTDVIMTSSVTMRTS